MKTTRSSLTLDTKLTGQYRQLFRRLGLLTLVILALTTFTVVYFDKKKVEDLSRKLISSTASTVVEKLTSFFQTADNNLRIAIEQLQLTEEQDRALMERLFFRLSPFLSQSQNASSIIVTEVGTSTEYLGISKPEQTESEFLVRLRSSNRWGRDRVRLERWKDGEMLESWVRKDDFDPLTRPWYKDALRARENEIVATEPYMYHTTKKPGITIATRWRKRDTDRQFITAIDIMLSNISRFTQAMRPTENGLVFVFTKDLRLVGLPADTRFSDENAVNAALFKTIGEVDLPLLQAGVTKWKRRGHTRQSFPFRVDGRNWWAGFEWNQDHPDQKGFWTGILVPESDFLGLLSIERNFALAAIIGLGFVSALALTLHAVRKIRSDLRETVSGIGRKLGPFELQYRIGGGGNGTVYRARHALLKRPTAVKVMLPQFASSEPAKERFINEVQITSSLMHPNTVAVFDFGHTPEGTLYYAMEHLSGVTLEDLVRISGSQPATRVLYILDQVCGSLNEAHGKDLVHRDIKPTNIMLCEQGGLHDVVKVLDFGLVKDIQQSRPGLTQADALVGTPFYMAPELITKASAFSPSSDLYALGGVGYFLLTGRNVFEGASTVEICAMHLHEEPVPPSQRTSRKIPPDLEEIIMACLAKQPELRPQSAEAMSEMLARCEGLGVWTRAQAREWWVDNRSMLPMEEHEETHSPLSNTQLLVDEDAQSGP